MEGPIFKIFSTALSNQIYSGDGSEDFPEKPPMKKIVDLFMQSHPSVTLRPTEPTTLSDATFSLVRRALIAAKERNIWVNFGWTKFIKKFNNIFRRNVLAQDNSVFRRKYWTRVKRTRLAQNENYWFNFQLFHYRILFKQFLTKLLCSSKTKLSKTPFKAWTIRNRRNILSRMMKFMNKVLPSIYNLSNHLPFFKC